MHLEVINKLGHVSKANDCHLIIVDTQFLRLNLDKIVRQQIIFCLLYFVNRKSPLIHILQYALQRYKLLVLVCISGLVEVYLLEYLLFYLIVI